MSTPTEPKLPKLAGIYGRGTETQTQRQTRSALALLRACVDSPQAQGAQAPERPQRELDPDATLDEHAHASVSCEEERCSGGLQPNPQSSARTCYEEGFIMDALVRRQRAVAGGASVVDLVALLEAEAAVPALSSTPSRAPSPIALLGQTYHDAYDDA